jgi:hypothetical protein
MDLVDNIIIGGDVVFCVHEMYIACTAAKVLELAGVGTVVWVPFTVAACAVISQELCGHEASDVDKVLQQLCIKSLAQVLVDAECLATEVVPGPTPLSSTITSVSDTRTHPTQVTTSQSDS